MSKPPPKSSSKKEACKDGAKKAPFIPRPGACVFCLSDEDCQDKFGKMITKYGLTVHYFCMLFASGLCQNGKTEKEGIFGFMPKDITKETTRGKRLKCINCQHVGATIGCVVAKCRKVFHFHCGLEGGALNQYFGNFSSFCEEHRPRQSKTVSKAERLAFKGTGNSTCAICMQAIRARAANNTLRTPCCRSAWYHRACIQRQALCAGLHFFKCPLCNNKEVFQTEMLEFGIYIPDQDAAWELEPNAFQELLQRHSRCDVEPCKCPHGPDYNKEEDRKWEIVLCDWCGSQGCHIVCGKLKRQSDDWICPQCLVIGSPVSKKKKSKSKKAAPASPKYNKDWYEQKGKSHYPGKSAYSRKRKRTGTMGDYDPRKKPRLMECSVVLERHIPRPVTATVTSSSLQKMEETKVAPPTVRRRSWLERRSSDASSENSKECIDEVTLQNRPKWFKHLMKEDIVTGRSLGNKLASYKDFATSHIVMEKGSESSEKTCTEVIALSGDDSNQKLGDSCNPVLESKSIAIEPDVPDTIIESKVPDLESKQHISLQSVPKSSPRWLKKLMSSDIFTGVNLGSKFSAFTATLADGDQIGKNIVKRSTTEAAKTITEAELTQIDSKQSPFDSPVKTPKGTPSDTNPHRNSAIFNSARKSQTPNDRAHTPLSQKLSTPQAQKSTELELKDTLQGSLERKGQSLPILTNDSNVGENLCVPNTFEKVEKHSTHARRSLVYAKKKKEKRKTRVRSLTSLPPSAAITDVESDLSSPAAMPLQEDEQNLVIYSDEMHHDFNRPSLKKRKYAKRSKSMSTVKHTTTPAKNTLKHSISTINLLCENEAPRKSPVRLLAANKSMEVSSGDNPPCGDTSVVPSPSNCQPSSPAHKGGNDSVSPRATRSRKAAEASLTSNSVPLPTSSRRGKWTQECGNSQEVASKMQVTPNIVKLEPREYNNEEVQNNQESATDNQDEQIFGNASENEDFVISVFSPTEALKLYNSDSSVHEEEEDDDLIVTSVKRGTKCICGRERTCSRRTVPTEAVIDITDEYEVLDLTEETNVKSQLETLAKVVTQTVAVSESSDVVGSQTLPQTSHPTLGESQRAVSPHNDRTTRSSASHENHTVLPTTGSRGGLLPTPPNVMMDHHMYQHHNIFQRQHQNMTINNNLPRWNSHAERLVSPPQTFKRHPGNPFPPTINHSGMPVQPQSFTPQRPLLQSPLFRPVRNDNHSKVSFRHNSPGQLWPGAPFNNNWNNVQSYACNTASTQIIQTQFHNMISTRDINTIPHNQNVQYNGQLDMWGRNNAYPRQCGPFPVDNSYHQQQPSNANSVKKDWNWNTWPS